MIRKLLYLKGKFEQRFEMLLPQLKNTLVGITAMRDFKMYLCVLIIR